MTAFGSAGRSTRPNRSRSPIPDQYLMAYEGYLAEGKILEADEQKALYLAKKAEIRERFPDK